MTQPMTQTEIQTLAAVYADAIKDALTTDEWNEIVGMNDASKYGTKDATDGYVGSQQFLLAAYEEIYGEDPPMDEQNMTDLAAAVDYALKHFYKSI